MNAMVTRYQPSSHFATASSWAHRHRGTFSSRGRWHVLCCLHAFVPFPQAEAAVWKLIRLSACMLISPSLAPCWPHLMPRSDELKSRLTSLQHELSQGDAIAALYGLPRLITDLRELTQMRPGTATGTAKLTQNPEPVLLPGVDEAIKQLEQSLEVLKTWLA